MEIYGLAQGSLLVRPHIRSHTFSRTPNGVIIGMDMASSFLEVLAGKAFAELVRTGIELGVKNREDDEFAEVHGLV